MFARAIHDSLYYMVQGPPPEESTAIPLTLKPVDSHVQPPPFILWRTLGATGWHLFRRMPESARLTPTPAVKVQMSDSTRNALIGVAISVALLIPGILAPVITVTGYLEPDGLAAIAPDLLEQGVSAEAIEALKPVLNPAILPLMELAPGGLKGAIISTLGSQLAEQLKAGAPIEVYQQTRSIVGSVEHLFRVGSVLAAALILLFSVVVPLGKAAAVSWAVLQTNAATQSRTLSFVETIAKWSMADVFAVALFIVFLAAQASQTPPGDLATVQVVSFDASFGAGFYWFTAYCIVSLAVHQLIARRFRSTTA